MLARLALKNFKGHSDTVLKLSPFTLLVGPNGSGKSTVLEAVDALGDVLSNEYDPLLLESTYREDVIRHAPDAIQFLLSAEDLAGNLLTVQVSLTDLEDGADDGWDFKCSVRRGSGGLVKFVEFKDAFDLYVQLSRHLPELRCQLLRLDARRIAAPSRVRVSPRVSQNGTGTASVLANLKLADDDRLGLIFADLRRVVPQVERVRTVPASIPRGKEVYGGYELRFDVRGGGDIPATGMSEGTLIALALVTILHQPDGPRTLLLDDVGQGLHPNAQLRLMEVLRAITTGPDPVQIIATTHSPYIIDAMELGEVQVFALRPDGTIATKSLAEHPEAGSYRGALSAGQLWTLDEEKDWVVSGA